MRKVYHRLQLVPILGRMLRIIVTVLRLPEMRQTLDRISFTQLETERIRRTSSNSAFAMPGLSREGTQLLTESADTLNLMQSLPVYLRRHHASQLKLLELIQAQPDQLAFTHQLQLACSDPLHKMLDELADLRVKAEQRHNAYEKVNHDVLERLQEQSHINHAMRERLEFIRRELMFEMRYGAHAPVQDAQPQVATIVRNADVLSQQNNGPVRLNLGCGHVPMEGYINVDRRDLPGIDIQAEVKDLPFESGTVSEIYSAHLLEHFPEEQLLRELLPYWISLLKPGGIFRAVVPDGHAMIQAYADGSVPFSTLREITFGAQDYDGDFHFNMFTPDHLKKLLEGSGLVKIVLIAEARRNGLCYEFEMKGEKV